MKREPDMSPAELTRRLRELGELSERRKRFRKSVDMSEPAVSARVRRVSELRELCLVLGSAGFRRR